MRTGDETMTPDELEDLCRAAVRGAGGGPRTADVLARATVAAERRGRSSVGAGHLLDYLSALREGRLAGEADPVVTRPLVGTVLADAREGTAHAAFEAALPELDAAARSCGVAVLSIRGAFSAGELGWYARRLADDGLVALVAGNSPALMSAFGAPAAVTGTNPLAFALPHPDGVRAFDQASSETAWVSVRDAAARGEELPEGWALGSDGRPTTDARDALDGALVPFGGAKGSNIALMIELLAVLSGGALSREAAPFDRGSESPRLGLFALALDPNAFDAGYSERVEAHLARLAQAHGADFGRRRPPLERILLEPRIRRALADAAGVAA
ncbi:Ldh family oxidoreductase [Microbacterium excoecariae]|uniref:Ldh family oxidoreductase n=1 Tax=Microbacterium excoecariae TaxID=2715210 RepID=UPI0014091541|nr:Ldh family oxidoreductase [Microbacterium excoecariae]NHI15919.1 Ldh family oxidoreductase [Microbacterium excoecariae]